MDQIKKAENIHGKLPDAEDYSAVSIEQIEEGGKFKFKLATDPAKKKAAAKKAAAALKAKIDNETATAAEVRKVLKATLNGEL